MIYFISREERAEIKRQRKVFSRVTGLLPITDDFDYTKARQAFYEQVDQIERKHKESGISEDSSEIFQLLREHRAQE